MEVIADDISTHVVVIARALPVAVATVVVVTAIRSFKIMKLIKIEFDYEPSVNTAKKFLMAEVK